MKTAASVSFYAQSEHDLHLLCIRALELSKFQILIRWITTTQVNFFLTHCSNAWQGCAYIPQKELCLQKVMLAYKQRWPGQ